MKLSPSEVFIVLMFACTNGIRSIYMSNKSPAVLTRFLFVCPRDEEKKVSCLHDIKRDPVTAGSRPRPGHLLASTDGINTQLVRMGS